MHRRYLCAFALLGMWVYSLVPAFAQQRPADVIDFERIGTGPNDFGWVRGRYGTGPEREQWNNLLDQARDTARERSAAAQVSLRQYDLSLDSKLLGSCFGDETCDWVMRTERAAAAIGSWQRFEAAWAEARPVVAGVVRTATRASDAIRQALGEGAFEAELQARFTSDQLLRAAYADSQLPLSADGRQLFGLVIGMVITRVDRSNAEWLRRTVETSGWPHPPQVSRQGEMAAWIMVLHARHDPELRLRVLGLMRHLAENGLFSRATLATRVDHVLFETTGTQRFGTSGECRGPTFVPFPSEHEDRVPHLRRDEGLPTLEEQERIMSEACSRSPVN